MKGIIFLFYSTTSMKILPLRSLSKNHSPNYPRSTRKVQGQQVYISYPSAIMRTKRMISINYEEYEGRLSQKPINYHHISCSTKLHEDRISRQRQQESTHARRFQSQNLSSIYISIISVILIQQLELTSLSFPRALEVALRLSFHGEVRRMSF